MHPPPRKMRETQNKIKTRLFENETKEQTNQNYRTPFFKLGLKTK